MGSDFTAAEQALFLIDIVVTEAALFVWVFWSIDQRQTKLKDRRSLEVRISVQD